MQPYLYTNPNRHAPVRTNGIRGWFHPSRRGGLPAIRHIVIHTAENTPDLLLPDGGAEAVARFQSNTDRPSSYHRIVDSDSVVLMLPDQAVAFGARGANTSALHLSFATKAALWRGMSPMWKTQALIRAAAEAREWVQLYRIPIVRLGRSDWRANRGFVAHADVDPSRRTDPGPEFPWTRFLDLVRHGPTLTEHERDDEMREGSPREGDVRKLQTRLNNVAKDVGFARLKVDGDFGPKTKAAVEAFQRSQGLTADGIVSMATAEQLWALAHGVGSHA